MAQLTPSEQETLVHGLNVAAQRFEEDRDLLGVAAPKGLVEQFDKQAKETRWLAQKLEEAYKIEYEIETGD